MEKHRICLNAFLILLFVIALHTLEAGAQNDNVQGIWSGTVTVKQTYSGEIGNSVLEITTSFSANRGTGTMKYEGRWKGVGAGTQVDCSGSGSAELFELSMSESDDPTYYEYYIHIIGPDYTCSPPDQEGGQNKRDVSISDKVLATNLNVLSGIQTFTSETGAGPGTTVLTWHLTRSTVNNVELIVTPEKYDTWLPEPGMHELGVGSIMNVSLKLQAKGGGPTTKKVKSFQLKLSNTSTEPGVTINFPPEAVNPMPDLRFMIQPNASIGDDKFQSLAIGCSGCQSAQFKIGAYDGGGWTTLTAEAILTDGTRVPGHLLVSGGESDIRIPKRDPNSKIGEAWLKKYNNPGEMDDNETSTGNKNNGDGFTAYEEYRGVISEGKFKRLVPDKKELGILATPRDFTLFTEGINWFRSASKLEIIRFNFDKNEIAGSGQINVNKKTAHDYDQYALYLLNGGLGGGTLGVVYSRTNKPDVPAQVIGVVADWNEIQAVYQLRVNEIRPETLKYALREYLAQTVAHELGHAVNVWHHGRNLKEPDVLAEEHNRALYRIFDRNGNLINIRPWELTFVGKGQGTVESGDISCMLNYYPYYRWGYALGADRVNIYNQEPLLPLGKIFCTSKSGTGINATQLYFGEAANNRGNCLSQVKLR